MNGQESAASEARSLDVKVSVVIPVFNEESVILELISRVTQVFESLSGGPHELVFADDGSCDSTWELIQQAMQHEDRIKAVSLSRNFGHQVALTAALDHASGDVLVMMDGDLQDRPEAIPQLLELWRRGADVVYVVRHSRKEDWLLRGCYHAFYRVMNRLAEVQMPMDAGDFCLVSRRVADVMRHSRERHRYLRGLRAWAGFNQSSITVERDARFAGKTKYGWKKLFGLAFDGILSFSKVPLRLATWIGLVTLLLAFCLGIFWIVGWAFGMSPQGFTALAISITFFGGVQLLFLGLLGEYVGRIHEEIKQRPLYVVKQSLGLPTTATIFPPPFKVGFETAGHTHADRSGSLRVGDPDTVINQEPDTVTRQEDITRD